MTIPKLGKLVTVTAKSVWQLEAQSFTPWLAQNLELLSDALDLGDLELKGTETWVGDFRLDILAEDADNNPVLIENQFGRTDHGHLGQLITYMAGRRENITAIWIAEEVREEHRAAIDWLNSVTSDGVNFFAVEVVALQIGDSDPAPFFRIVSRPNNWTRAIDAKIAGDQDLAERHIARMAYWASFADFVKAHDPSFHVRPDNKEHSHGFRIGKAGFSIGGLINRKKTRIGVELYIQSDPGKTAIRALERDRAEIEREIGSPLEWQELPGKIGSRVALYKAGIDVTDEANYPAINAWMLENLQRFRSAFQNRVKNLDLNDEEHDPA